MFETAIIFLLLIALFAAANEAEKGRKSGENVTKFACYIIVFIVYLALFIVGVTFNVLAQNSDVITNFKRGLEQFPVNLESMNVGLMGAGMWIPALLGMLVLLRPVRVLVAKLIPIDPDHVVHTISLSAIMLVAINLIVTLSAGLEALANSFQNISLTFLVATLWIQNGLTVLLAMIGVGWLVRRDWAEVQERLKVGPLTLKKLGVGIGFGLLLVVFMTIVGVVANGIGLGDAGVEQASEALYGPLLGSFWGILTVALAAPIGEELLFRGAAQPRFGRVLTAFIFAVIHSNYGFSYATFAVFVIGYVLGILRDRYDTTTSIIGHSTFNLVQVLLTLVAMRFVS